METQSKKRTEAIEELLPADKRPKTSEQTETQTQTQMSGTHETQNADSSQSNSSNDSDTNPTQFERVLINLSNETDQSVQLVALTELCQLLSFCTDISLSSWIADSYSPILVKLIKMENNPDIMLLSVRAMTYLCDVHPRSSAFLVKHDAVSAICQRLLAIEYLDVAEQCLQALEKISREQPLACFQSGAIMAALNYMDFFSTNVQRVALSIVVNICKKLPSGHHSLFMNAVPILCNLLQYEDLQLVECAATCLIKIVERVFNSSELIDEICKHGFIQKATGLIDLKSQTTVSQLTHYGLLGSLVKMTGCSNLAFKTLHELNISKILKEIISTCNLSHGPLTPKVDDHPKQAGQVHEVLKLLNELLPVKAGEKDIEISEEKMSFLMNQPYLVQNFVLDILPFLIQAVNSGSNLYICYGCLAIINKLVYFSKPEILIQAFGKINIASFLAGVFTRKDHHVIILALQITNTVLQKLSKTLINSFVKEGVFFAIDALLYPEKFSNYMITPNSSNDSNKPCLCFVLESGPRPGPGTCKLVEETVQNLAKSIKENYFATELNGLSHILQNLKSLSSELMNVLKLDGIKQEEGYLRLLREIMMKLNGDDPVSNFEFITSGILNALAEFLDPSHDLYNMRFEIFGKVIFEKESVFLGFLRRLQSVLSSIENFPVILFDISRLRNSHVTVPVEKVTAYPSLQVQFLRDEDEILLGDYSGDVESVDPFSGIDLIEEYLLKRVKSSIQDSKGDEQENAVDTMEEEEASISSDSSSGSHTISLYLEGQKLDPTLTLYQAFIQILFKREQENFNSSTFWRQVYKITYTSIPKSHEILNPSPQSTQSHEKPNPLFDIFTVLKSLECMNRHKYQLISREKIFSFDNLQKEFVNQKLSDKLEQQIEDPLCGVHKSLPSWCEELLDTCPFLFTFTVRRKYFRLLLLSQPGQPGQLGQPRPKKKILVYRERIVESAAKIMECYASKNVIIEVQYNEEVGTGLGPTLEFYTLLGHEFRKMGLGLWREDDKFGLFPRPWSPSSNSKEFSGVLKKWVLLGQIVAKSLQDGRVLDLPLSRSFYKILLRKELTIYDIPTFDLELGRALLEFQALVERKRNVDPTCKKEETSTFTLSLQNISIEDLHLDFSLPGFPDYIFKSSSNSTMVNMSNLEEYVEFIVDATIKSGISRQIEAFESGFNQVFPIKNLQIFTEEEFELLLCGERELWKSNDLVEHIKFDHGYTSSSPPIMDLLEIIQEFDSQQQRAFLQFVTGGRSLPHGGLASLNPKMTIVRKHFSAGYDVDLPSVMTCANYLKLPPYSSKEKMKEKLLCAITEGQGAFHLS